MLESTGRSRVTLEIRSKLSWLAYSNILVGLSTASSLFTAFIFMNIEVYWSSLLLLFLVTFAIYSLDRNSETKLDRINQPERQEFVSSKSKFFLCISLVSYGAAIILAGKIELQLLLLIPLLFFAAYRYAGLKRIFLSKNITVAMAWATTISLMAISNEPVIPVAIWAFFPFFFLKTFAGAVAYDIKDVKGDSLFRIKTLPVKIGIQSTKTFLYIMNIVTSSIALYSAFLFSNASIYFISAIACYNFLYTYKIGKTDIKLLSNFAIHGDFILMGILAYLGTSLLL